jgi:tetratricopeptide (TPR) repeat protein
MSSTAPLDQRYMRALAHIPLLAMDRPERVLVIGFGVGNSTHAATLHPSVTRVDVADLSRNILTHASYFDDATHGVLQSPKVQVFVNDGRQHLQMEPPATYDLITLEPPPIAHAGVAALYSKEFYALARTRLKPGGYVSQWLPAYQVPSESSLAMVRAFVDVFPQAVLLSGSQAELILLGTTAPRIEIDPTRLQAALAAAPAVADDLRRFDLATPRDIIGTFVGSAETLRQASADAPPVTDDRPVQEYGVMSALAAAVTGVPASLFDVRAVTAWCPACFQGGSPASSVEDLDLYLDMLSESYEAPQTGEPPSGARPPLLGSEYLATVVPDSAEVHATLGLAHLRADRIDDAKRELEAALQRDPASATAKVGLAGIQYAEGERLLQQRRYDEAADRFRAALALKPDSAEAANNLGVALASMGRLAEAREQFALAVQLQPGFEQARENLAAAERSR